MKIYYIDAPEHLIKKISELHVLHNLTRLLEGLQRRQLHDIEHELEHDSEWGHPSYHDLSCMFLFDEESIGNIIPLLHSIPILLKDTKDMSFTNPISPDNTWRNEHKRDERRDDDRSEKNGPVRIVDPLGAYFAQDDGGYPWIEIYLSEIERCSHGDDNAFISIFIITLLHELSHSALDIRNCWRYEGRKERIAYQTEFGRWREESVANALTLKIIKYSNDKEFYEFAQCFMKSQPAEYALGTLYDCTDYWFIRYLMESKSQGVHPELQKAWLDYVKGCPEREGVNKWHVMLSARAVYYCCGRYSRSASDIVKYIIDRCLDEYYLNKGTKMTQDIFCSTFPNIRLDKERMAYWPTEKGEYEITYLKKIELSDGCYSLNYKSWDLNNAIQFIQNTGYKITEFVNY